MGNHYNYKEEKCWSCAFFCGVRKENKGFLGNSVETSSSGTCSCNRSSKYNCKVYDNDRGCFKYQRWGALDVSLAQQVKKEQQKANEKLINDQRRQEEEFQRQKEELERQTRELERERERLEYERWYSSLSPEEQKAEDIRKEEERAKIEKHLEEMSARWEEKRQREEAEKKKINKRLVIVFIAIIAAPLIVFGGIFLFFRIGLEIEEQNKRNEFYKSPTGIFSSYIVEKAGTNNDGVYSISFEDENRGIVYQCIEYKKEGFSYNSLIKYDFRVYTALLPTSENSYSKITGEFLFNLSGGSYRDSFGTWINPITDEEVKESPVYNAKVEYDDIYTSINFVSLGYDNDKKEPYSNGHLYINPNNWDYSLNSYEDEWLKDGWNACLLSYRFANNLYLEATGNNLYKV